MTILFFTACFVEVWALEVKEFEGYNLVTKKEILIKQTKRISVFYFLSASCPCSKSTFDYLNELQRKYPDFQFMGFHSNKAISRGVAETYFSNYEIDFPILLDRKLKFANMFKALKTPHVFVVNNNGDVLYHGGVTNSRFFKNAKSFFLEEALKDIKNGINPKRSHARALGCYIAR